RLVPQHHYHLRHPDRRDAVRARLGDAVPGRRGHGRHRQDDGRGGGRAAFRRRPPAKSRLTVAWMLSASRSIRGRRGEPPPGKSCWVTFRREGMMAYQETVVRRDQHLIHVRDYAGAGPPIILMHGFPDNLHLYDRLVPYLSPPRRVVLFDFLGWFG